MGRRSDVIDFGLTADTEPLWNPGAVEFVCAANSVSLMMPIVEPYFVRSVRRTLPRLSDDLQATVATFAAQELAHQGQHRAFNAAIRRRCRGISRLERIMTRTYRRLELRRSLHFNVAFAAASETIAYALARWSSRHLATFLGGSDEAVANMFIWHLAEEVGHKSVAYDVFEAIDGSRRRYAAAAVTTLILLGCFVTAGSVLQLAATRKLWNPLTWARLIRWAVSCAFEIPTALAVSAMPSHHPSQLTDPSWFGLWLSDFERQRA